MRVLRLAAMIFAIVGGYLALPGPASAAPLGAGALPFVQTEAPLVAKAQWGYRRGYGYGRGYGYRRGWGGYGYRRPIYGYGYRRPVYGWGGPGLVCRWRPSPWGPRRVCW
ncbi:MAG: hypothetical protein ACJ8CQ_21855 [Microvirga sp.]|jgi:hypothetical protein